MTVPHPLRSAVALAVASAAFLPCLADKSFAAAGGSELRQVSERPSSVDLRPEMRLLGLAPRAQGARGTCSIFTTCQAIEFAVAVRRGGSERLSPEFLNWAAGQAAGQPSDGNFFHNALAGFERFGLCGEATMPYRERFEEAGAPSAAALAAAAALRDECRDWLSIHWIVPWQAARFGVDDAAFAEILSVLARGFPVAAGSGHSRLLVGYRLDSTQPGGGVFLTDDSALACFSEVSFEFVRKEVADVFWVEARPPLACARELTLAEHGRSDYRIVVPAAHGPALDASARELQSFLAAISGAEIPIVEESAPAAGPAIYLGAGAKAAASGLLEEARALGEDGVRLRSVGPDLFLLGGGARGERYAVYELLERFLGCRFLARDCNVIPRRELLALPPIDHRHAPPFAYREVLCFEAADPDFAARLRLNGGNVAQCLGLAGGGALPSVVISPFVHSAEAMLPSARFFPANPEYFGLVGGARHGAPIGGQLCYTNPEVLRLCTEWVLQWLAAHPEVACVDVSQNDAYPGASGACECEPCAAVVREEGSQHGPILRFVNAIAAAVAERFPGKTIETLAYQHTLAAPKVTRPRDDVVIRLCQHACYFHGVDCAAIGAEFRAAIEDWRRVAKKVWVWHYGVDFWCYFAPNPNLGALAADLRRYARDGVDGVMVQGDLQSPGGELAELRTYLCAQLLWDPARDPLAIRREFCAGYFGPAQEEVLEFLALLDRWAEATPHHIPMNGWDPAEVTPPEVVAAGLEVLGRALAKAEDPAQRRRVEKLLLPLWYLQITAPERFGLARSDGAALLARVRRVIEENGITTISEGPPNAAAFLEQMQAAVGAWERHPEQ